MTLLQGIHLRIRIYVCGPLRLWLGPASLPSISPLNEGQASSHFSQ